MAVTHFSSTSWIPSLRRGTPGPHQGMHWSSPWLVAKDPVEVAAGAEQAGLARDALKQLAETTRPRGNDPALGVEARGRALLSNGADDLYCEAIDRLGRTELRPELARAHLLYGEWLRRKVGASTRTSSCARLTTCSPRSAWRCGDDSGRPLTKAEMLDAISLS